MRVVVSHRLHWPKLSRGWQQILLFTGAYLLYGLSRWLATGGRFQAVAHARAIWRLEGALHLRAEPTLQVAMRHAHLLWLLDDAYLAAQVAVVPLALWLLWRRDPCRYRWLRDTVLATWLLALPVFWLFPVAPPRLAGVGLLDTISHGAGLQLDSRLATSFYNPLAAVPSLHCGFALAVSLAMAGAARQRLARVLWLAWAPLIALSVLATGNHFVFDVAAGAAVTGTGAWVAARLRVAEQPRRQSAALALGGRCP